jgi:hypothetical protein
MPSPMKRCLPDRGNRVGGGSSPSVRRAHQALSLSKAAVAPPDPNVRRTFRSGAGGGLQARAAKKTKQPRPTTRRVDP